MKNKMKMKKKEKKELTLIDVKLSGGCGNRLHCDVAQLLMSLQILIENELIGIDRNFLRKLQIV